MLFSVKKNQELIAELDDYIARQESAHTPVPAPVPVPAPSPKNPLLAEVEELLLAHGLNGEPVSVVDAPMLYRVLIGVKHGQQIGRFDEAALARDLGAKSVSVIQNAGRRLWGIEVLKDSQTRRYVSLADMPDGCIGLSSDNKPVRFDISDAVHTLVAGTTGGGKSVAITTIFKQCTKQNDEVILIDGKSGVDYKGIFEKVISSPNQAADALAYYARLMDSSYEHGEPLSRRVVIVIDELADLLDRQEGDEILENIVRIAQMGRAARIHLIIGTQIPDADTLPIRLRANVPTRIALRVVKHQFSQIILNKTGAELLLGRGDAIMLTSSGEFIRLQIAA